ncbi:MAG: T9SS type A sorting domain-containing protein, partial [Chitinophagaceae bacterium]
PSPNSGLFQIRYYSAPGNTPLPRFVNVYDSKGARVYSQVYSVASPYSRMDVNMTNFQKGIYQVELADRNGVRIKTGRVVIL